MSSYSKKRLKPLLSKCWVALQVCAPFPDTQWLSPQPGSPHPRKRPADEPVTTFQHPQGRLHKDLVCCKGMTFTGQGCMGKQGSIIPMKCLVSIFGSPIPYCPCNGQGPEVGPRGKPQSNCLRSLKDSDKAISVPTQCGMCLLQTTINICSDLDPPSSQQPLQGCSQRRLLFQGSPAVSS